MINFDIVTNRLGTYCSQWDYVKDRFGQKDLLPFTISDMDIPTAPEVLSSMQKRLDHKILGYTRWNHSDYKNAIIHWYKNRFNYSISENWIAYSPNVMYAIVRMLHLFNPEKAPISFITPCYDGFIKILTANKYPMLPIHQSITNNEYHLDWAIFEEKVSQSKVFLLCNPNNPNGYLWNKNDLQKIVEICKKHNVAIISDDIHMDFVYKPAQFIPILNISEELDYLDKTVIITSSSKTFNISSIGGAYILCPNSTLLAEYLNILNNADSIGSASALHVVSLINGYTECSYWVDDLNNYIHKNHKFTQEFLQKNIPTIKFKPPQATYFAWLDCRDLNLSMQDIQDKLIKKGKVAIMDGNRYQESAPFLRMVQACPHSKIEEGLQKLNFSLSI